LLTQEIFWNIHYNYIVHITAAVTLITFLYCIYRRNRLWRLGTGKDSFEVIGQQIPAIIRISLKAKIGPFNAKLLNKTKGGAYVAG
jgi:hypothetical protein